MWTVVYIASKMMCAEFLKERLISEGMVVTLRSVGMSRAGRGGAIEIMVPESEAEEAHEILASAVTT
jgi:hypothetical protein